MSSNGQGREDIEMVQESKEMVQKGIKMVCEIWSIKVDSVWSSYKIEAKRNIYHLSSVRNT